MASSFLAFPVVLSFFVYSSPSFTTLNLIFFYMTWTTLILSHSPFKVEVVGTITVRLLFYVLPSALFYLFDILVPSAAVLLKAHGEQGLPTRSKRFRIRAKDFKVIGWSLFNISMSIIVQGIIESVRIGYFKTRSALKVSFSIPFLPWSIGLHLLYVLLLRETLAYCIHRFVLHNTKYRITRYLTRLHETWYHELHAPYPTTAHYDHPLPYLLRNTIPTLIPAVLCRLHMITYAIYLTIVSLEETLAYSGYSTMPMDFLLLGGIARRVDRHLISWPEGNYGPWGILDWILQTTIPDEGGEVVEVVSSKGDRAIWDDERSGGSRRYSMTEDELQAKVHKALDQHAKKTQRKHKKKMSSH
ncbi:sterol desaturase family protein [Aspergillus ibericus CBS 121593]|uniref:Sterol desaturase family protein n=1 Tax=Aspergillus ibericus CBS 121593 TaxID=1448316 RepID=A0A395GNF9_9EURO|nr:sterol desaturase family protein [Aspergillus ibericus CBS 121593]RAK97019.1 sterol desaturase family protein [Aspergillus ibericus CBS 121593]